MPHIDDERLTAPPVTEWAHRRAGRTTRNDLTGLARRLHADGMPRYDIPEVCGVPDVAAVDRLLAGDTL